MKDNREVGQLIQMGDGGEEDLRAGRYADKAPRADWDEDGEQGVGVPSDGLYLRAGMSIYCPGQVAHTATTTHLGDRIFGLGDQALVLSGGVSLQMSRELRLGGQRGLHRDDDIAGKVCDSRD